MKTVADIGPKVTHVYEVHNKGPWKASHFNIIISWPHQVGNNGSWPEGKWLFYPDKLPEVQGDGQCVLNDELINVLNLSLPTTTNFDINNNNNPDGGIDGSSSSSSSLSSISSNNVNYENGELRKRRTKRNSDKHNNNDGPTAETIVSADVEYDYEGHKRKIVKMVSKQVLFCGRKDK